MEKNILDLINEVGKLKSIKRAGWKKYPIQNVESVAEHSFRTSFIALIIGDYLDLNTCKLLKMSLLHDLAEIVVGDIIPNQKQKETKKEEEDIAFRDLLQHITNKNEYLEIWTEYIEQKTPEAKILKDIDKLELAVQAKEYEEKNNIKMDEFFLYANKKIENPMIKRIFDLI